MHIVQALVSLNLGGSELVAVELSEYAIAQGHQVTVVAADGPLGDRIRTCGASHLDWPIGKKRPGTLRYISRLRSWLARAQPDVLHVHSRLPAWICELALRGLDPALRPTYITSMHGHYSVSRYSAVMAGGDRVIAVSDHIREYTLHNYPDTDAERVVTVHGGVSHVAFPFAYRPDPSWHEQAAREFPALQGKRLVCLPGRLSRYKGHADFIELVANLAADVPEIHGVIVGTAKPGSRYRDELEGLAERYGVLDRITFTGARKDIRDWMAASEIVYSLCSDPPEAFGRTVPEALHMGVPVIGWNHGGVAETLAVLFPQGAVPPGDRARLLELSRSFLRNRPAVSENTAFGLTESMEKTFSIYQSAQLENKP
ncbi:MAG: glycosyltransferase [Xanthomonadales bacterium]|nr:glycosyltransferase [Gammaproteobacteria bacterium]MBT8053025.1 glycosyltransferase [Gammaproteobacteria bacterium]NND57917.1 glycosyltransferase [Xanthomonadales bacterium]NNK50797.1 glycosyltransferase [Xanthomonadales bacterium]